MIKKIAAFLALIWVLALAAAPAAAEPCPRAVPLDAGDVAPCKGDLTPTPWVHSLLRDRRTRRELERELALIDERHRRELAGADQSLEAERAARLACEHERAPPPAPRAPWWQRPGWVFAGGVLVGGLAVGLAVAL